MSLLLAIETSVGPFSIALFKDSTLIASYYHNQPHQQAELLLPSIGNLLSDNGFTYKDVEVIAASVGPGSFTGIRIGLAAAQGISLATHCQIIGVSTLEAIAMTKQEGSYAVALAAGRGQFYWQAFDCNNGPAEAIGEGRLIDEEKMHINHNDLIISKTHESYPYLSAKNVGLVALNRLSHGYEITPPSPIYIRDADAKLPENCNKLVLSKK